MERVRVRLIPISSGRREHYTSLLVIDPRRSLVESTQAAMTSPRRRLSGVPGIRASDSMAVPLGCLWTGCD